MQSKDFYCASNKLDKIKCKHQCFDCKGYGEKPKNNNKNVIQKSTGEALTDSDRRWKKKTQR